MGQAEPARPRVSVVVVSYEMDRELPRTVRSLSPAMQAGIEPGDYELIVVDNGSASPPDPDALTAFGADVRVIHAEGASPSPARAANQGIAAARAPLVGVLIDGARLASPGLLRQTLLASTLSDRGLVATLGLHLGAEPQQRSVAHGYDSQAEDQLLDRVEWTSDGYRLFEIACFGRSAPHGWFEVPAESNAVFAPRELWSELGGYDEAFESPGGGLVNHDLFARACALPDVDVFVLLGEATFHQVHGGVSTNASRRPWDEFHAEYVHLRGKDFAVPPVSPRYIGDPVRVGSAFGSGR